MSLIIQASETVEKFDEMKVSYSGESEPFSEERLETNTFSANDNLLHYSAGDDTAEEDNDSTKGKHNATNGECESKVESVVGVEETTDGSNISLLNTTDHPSDEETSKKPDENETTVVNNILPQIIIEADSFIDAHEASNKEENDSIRSYESETKDKVTIASSELELVEQNTIQSPSSWEERQKRKQPRKRKECTTPAYDRVDFLGDYWRHV